MQGTLTRLSTTRTMNAAQRQLFEKASAAIMQHAHTLSRLGLLYYRAEKESLLVQKMRQRVSELEEMSRQLAELTKKT